MENYRGNCGTVLTLEGYLSMPKEWMSQVVFSVLDDLELAPRDLFDALKREGLSESDAKETLSYLISDHQIEMTESRRLRRPVLAA